MTSPEFRSKESEEVLPPDPNCEYCNGTGAMDSGGVTPWMEAISIRCNCTYPDYRKK